MSLSSTIFARLSLQWYAHTNLFYDMLTSISSIIQIHPVPRNNWKLYSSLAKHNTLTWSHPMIHSHDHTQWYTQPCFYDTLTFITSVLHSLLISLFHDTLRSISLFHDTLGSISLFHDTLRSISLFHDTFIPISHSQLHSHPSIPWCAHILSAIPSHP